MSEARQQAERWLRTYHGSIDSTALIMAHEAGQRSARVRAAREADLARMTAKTAQAVSLPDRGTLIEVFRQTRCIATPKLERGYCCPVPEEAERMADAVLAALSPASIPEIPDNSRWSLAQVAGMIRRNCTPSSEAYQRGGDALIYAVADWVENPPEWVLAAQTKPAVGVTEDALADLRESVEQELELGGDASTLVPAVTEWLKRWPLAALSTQPAAGRTGQHALRSTYAGFHCTCGEWRIGSWNGADEAFAEHVEAAEPAPELAELFPGTLEALDRLSIRPEVQ